MPSKRTWCSIQEALALLSDADAQNNINSEKLVKAVTLQLPHVQAVYESTMQEVKTDLVVVRTEQGARFAGVDPLASKEPADELVDFILSEERDLQTPTKEGQAGASSRVKTETPPSSPDVSVDNGVNVRSILSKLMDDVKNVQAAKQHSSVKFGSLGFTDLADCSAWIESHFSGHHYGLTESGGALLKAMDLQHKMKIDSGNETAALLERSSILSPEDIPQGPSEHCYSAELVPSQPFGVSWRLEPWWLGCHGFLCYEHGELA